MWFRCRVVHIALLLSQNHVRMMEPYPGEGFGFGDRIRLCLLQCYLFCFLPLKYIVLSMTCLWFFRLLIIHAYIGELLLQIRYSHNNSTFFFPFVCEKLFDFFSFWIWSRLLGKYPVELFMSLLCQKMVCYKHGVLYSWQI